jgi:hypothetical protein
MDDTAAGGPAYQRTEPRIAWLTLAFGVAGAAIAAFFFSWRDAAGVLAGAGLAWFNFRWLRRGIDALVEVSSDPAGPRPKQAQVIAALRAAGRYALLGLAIYVIFKLFGVPLLSIVVGLCALGAAATAASLYEILHSSE